MWHRDSASAWTLIPYQNSDRVARDSIFLQTVQEKRHWSAPQGGDTLIFSYIRRLGSFWGGGGGGLKFLNFDIFGVFRKILFFFEYEDFVDIYFFFGGVIARFDYI